MTTHCFTHPNASDLASQDSEIATNLMKGKTIAVRHNGRAIRIAEFKSYTMHSQEASRFELIDSEGYLIGYYANGQFWDSLTKTLLILK